MNMVVRSFKLRLILSYFLVILVSFGFIAFFLDKNLEENSLQTMRSSLIAQARLIEVQIPAESLKQGDTAALGRLVSAFVSSTTCRITIINNTGAVLADSGMIPEEVLRMENHLYRPEVKTALAGDIASDIRYSPTLKLDMLYVALPLREGNAIQGVLRLALGLEGARKTSFAIRRTVFLGLLIALGLALVFGSLIAHQTIKPINRMIQVSRKFSEGDFSRRILRPGQDEIGELAVTLNKMAQDIENKIKEITAQNQKLAAIFNSMIEGVMVIDKTSRIVSVNSTIEKIFGVAKDDVAGKVFLEAIRNNDIAEIIDSVVREGKPLTAEITLLYPARKFFEVSATPIFDAEGIAGCLVVIHDITELTRLETIRRDFVANVSHELKTPLTSIKGFVETLLEGALDDKENNRNFLQIIQHHAERLDDLIHDLLSLSHLESKEITLQMNTLPVRRHVEAVIAGFTSQLRKKNIEISNEVPAGISVNADKEKITQVLTNLIDNAVKFNKEKGSIRIYSLEISGKVKVIVEDSGAGIPEKDIPRIFERFYRVDKARSRELGGTGLGLSIVKHIIELHGGTVGVESTEGFGSKFWFTLLK